MNTTKFRKEIRGAVQLREPDFDALKKCIDDMRGMRSIVVFAQECGLAPNTLQRTVAGRRSRPMLPGHLDIMYDKRCPESSVTRDMLYYADGLQTPSEAEGSGADYASIQAQIDALEWVERKDLGGRPKRTEADDGEKDTVIDMVRAKADRGDGTFVSFEEFVHDLTLYMSGLSEEEYGSLYKKRDDLFKDKWIVSILKSYADAQEKNCEANRTAVETYCAYDEGLENCSREAQYAKQLLDRTLGVSSRVSQKLESGYFE